MHCSVEQPHRWAEKDFVVVKHHIPSANLRTTFEKIIDRAGLKRWPKPFQNLRASCWTQLFRDGHDIKTVSEWLGHSPEVGLKHYAMSCGFSSDIRIAEGRETALQKAMPGALQKPLPQGTIQNRMESSDNDNSLREQEKSGLMGEDTVLCENAEQTQTDPTEI
ncbi:MAG: hypothetical protein HZA50_12725 [Planctomycetes bacterium]|nr:hypothetical protein [Planctomycetota bacterium]